MKNFHKKKASGNFLKIKVKSMNNKVILCFNSLMIEDPMISKPKH